MHDVPDERGSDHYRPRRDLTEGYAVHKCGGVHPSLHMNDLLQHERQGREAPAEGEEVHLDHQQGQIEKARKEKITGKEGECGSGRAGNKGCR